MANSRALVTDSQPVEVEVVAQPIVAPPVHWARTAALYLEGKNAQRAMHSEEEIAEEAEHEFKDVLAGIAVSPLFPVTNGDVPIVEEPGEAEQPQLTVESRAEDEPNEPVEVGSETAEQADHQRPGDEPIAPVVSTQSASAFFATALFVVAWPQRWLRRIGKSDENTTG